jgi:hypothetical protein
MARPILPWRSPLVLAPTDGDAVWIRRFPWFDTPVRATYNVAGTAWLDVRATVGPDLPLHVEVPWHTLHSWKFQFKAQEDAWQAARGPDDPH